MNLSDFKVLTFDCYGTLIDWESGMVAGLKPLTDRIAARDGRPLDRNAILEAHARQESFHQRQTPAKTYSDLLACVYRRLAEEWGCRCHGTRRWVMAVRSRTGLPLPTPPSRWPI